jgi:hypothetical protein
MLSEEEKKRIEVIETYKFEVIDKLQTKKSKKFGLAMVFSFFNSKFGLWVLSAIFVSGGVKVYDDYKVKQENEKTRSEIIEKLDNEIAFKFNKLLGAIDLMKEKEVEVISDQIFSNMEEAKSFALWIKKETGKEENYLYEEYKYWSLLALLVEQKRQLDHLKIKDPELEEVISHLNELQNFFENRQLNYHDIDSIKEIIQENLVLSRWKSNGLFSY